MNYTFGFLAGLLLYSQTGFAGQLSDLDIYARCYVRMVRLTPDPVNDTIYQQVESGKLKGPVACLQLFDSAAWSSQGVMINRTSSTARAIVKTFNDLHVTWFSSRAPASYGGGGQALIYDIQEGPLYFTRAVFQQKEPFSSVVTLDSGLQGLRDVVVPTSTGDTLQAPGSNFLAQKLAIYSSKMKVTNTSNLLIQYVNETLVNGNVKRSMAALTVPDGDTVQVGQLVGVRVPNTVAFPSAILDTDQQNPSLQDATNIMNALVANVGPYTLNQHFGGGILGSQGFLAANVNLGPSVNASYVANINRRWSSRVFSDLLCEQEPTLTVADVAGDVQATSPYTFRTSTSCLQCHDSNDPAAFLLNNLYVFSSSPEQPSVGFRLFGIGQLPVSTSSNPVCDYSQSPAGSTGACTPWALVPTSQLNAKLFYRENLAGSKASPVSLPVSSLDDMGAKLAAGNDLYLCAAKRYYYFFTGISVDLTTRASQELDLEHQNFVIKLGRDLKKSQSVRSLLGEIFNSPEFATRNYQTAEAQ